MIRKARPDDMDDIFHFISFDFARNYFIALGLLNYEKVYKDIYLDVDMKIRGMLFHRHSNNIQFVAYGAYDVKGFGNLLKELDFNHLISPASYCKDLEPYLEVVHSGALIAELSKDVFQYEAPPYLVRPLMPNDVEAVERLYSTRFDGYPKAAFMKTKLLEERGIGFCIEDHKLVSVAQSEWGYVIVGVATELSKEGKGYAKSCLLVLIQTLFEKHDKIYLQYDNPSAGILYRKLGFQPVDQVIHYKKR